MSQIKIAINGMGRIGRTILREIIHHSSDTLQVVAVNNPGQVKSYLHLLQFDSVHGPLKTQIEYSENASQFFLNGKKIKFYGYENPREIPWGEDQVDIVIDATGRFKDKNSLGLHKRNSVKKVIMCAPGKDLDNTFVFGVNHHTYRPQQDHIVSNASCTTNCLAPIAKVLHDKFGIRSGFMTTVHAYTSDQQLLDGSHSDLRRARAAALSMIPTTTGAAKSVGLIIPELQGKLDGLAIRVPTPNVSLVDFAVNLNQTQLSIETINQEFIKASQGPLQGILKTEKLPLVSNDYTGMKESSCIDLTLTKITMDMIKIIAWYDNEAGFSNRVIDLAEYIGKKL